MMVNIVIPMAGAGNRFAQAGYKKPKPFIDVLGKPMIARVVENLKYKDARYIFIARKDHMEQEEELIGNLKAKYNAIFVSIENVTEGAACTVLFAREYINNDDPLLIANSDQMVDIDISDFIDDSKKRDLDGSILTFHDSQPKWSYAKLDKHKYVTEVREKEVVSNFATVGIYYFEKGETFVNGSIDMIINGDRVNNEFYVAPVYNYSIRSGAKIGIYNIEKDQMHGTGTPADLDLYIKSMCSVIK